MVTLTRKLCLVAALVVCAGTAYAQNFQFWPPQNFESARGGLPKCQAGDMTVVRTDLNPPGIYCQKPPTPGGQSCAATVRSCCGTAVSIGAMQHLQIHSAQRNNASVGFPGVRYTQPDVYCVYQCVNGTVQSHSDSFSCSYPNEVGQLYDGQYDAQNW
ncbi:MAG: hypothetical protein EBQ89_00835 [Alphaproteobacteria bacterium]|nr:hypothetical protein [Alphaproteobacteria bacterium]